MYSSEMCEVSPKTESLNKFRVSCQCVALTLACLVVFITGLPAGAQTLHTGSPSASTSGAAFLPPNSPPMNLGEQPYGYGQYFGTNNQTGAWYGANVSATSNMELASINQGRIMEGLGPIVLPSNWDSLSYEEQLFVLVNLERTARGEGPITAELSSLDTSAMDAAWGGCNSPALIPVCTSSSVSNWFGGLSSGEQANIYSLGTSMTQGFVAYQYVAGVNNLVIEGNNVGFQFLGVFPLPLSSTPTTAALNPIATLQDAIYNNDCVVGSYGGPVGEAFCGVGGVDGFSGYGNSYGGAFRAVILANTLSGGSSTQICTSEIPCFFGAANAPYNTQYYYSSLYLGAVEVTNASGQTITPPPYSSSLTSQIEFTWQDELKYLPACEQSGDTCSVATTTAVSSTLSSSGSTISATISSGEVGPVEGGTVTFTSNGTPISGCTNLSVPVYGPTPTNPPGLQVNVNLNDYTYQGATYSLTPGQPFSTTITCNANVSSSSISAIYSGWGDGNGQNNFFSSSSSSPQPTTLTISANPTTITSRGSANLTATLAISGVTLSPPTGTISFLANGTPITNCTDLSIINNSASCSASLTPPVSVTASYSGDTNYAFSVSSSVSITQATCPAGDTGTPPNCQKPNSECPQGEAGTPPNCTTYNGYYLVESGGQVASFGTTPTLTCSLTIGTPVASASVNGGTGLIATNTQGDIGVCGSAQFYWPNASPSSNVASLGATNNGYWLATSNGQVITAGSAGFFGSPQAAGLTLRGSIVDMAITPDGKGYWLLGSDGGVFSYGDAAFYGSTGNLNLDAPAVAMAGTPDGNGYWFVASDGGVFFYGDANFYGSMGGKHLAAPIIGIVPTQDGGGYWFVGSDGGVFAFGDASFVGSLGGSGSQVVSMAGM